jgi:hypothetical protein
VDAEAGEKGAAVTREGIPPAGAVDDWAGVFQDGEQGGGLTLEIGEQEDVDLAGELVLQASSEGGKDLAITGWEIDHKVEVRGGKVIALGHGAEEEDEGDRRLAAEGFAQRAQLGVVGKQPGGFAGAQRAAATLTPVGVQEALGGEAVEGAGRGVELGGKGSD